MPKFKNEEEKKKFIESCLPIYVKLFGEENAQKILDQQLIAKSPISEEKYQLAERRNNVIISTFNKLYDEKYMYFKGYEISNFQRVVRAMFKPETTLENIKYNEMLATKTMTREGCIEILQEAVTILGQLTPELYKNAQEDPSVFDKHLAAFKVGFVTSNVIEGLNEIQRSLPEEFEKYFPKEVVRLMETNKRFYEEFSTFEAEVKVNSSKYLYAIPDVKDIDVLLGMSAYLEPKYKKEVSEYLHFVGTMKEKSTFIDVDEFTKRSEEMTQEEKEKSLQEQLEQTNAEIKTIKFFNPIKSQKCIDYFKEIQARMAKESLNDNKLSEKYRENKKIQKDILRLASYSTVPFVPKDDIQESNQDAVDKRTEGMLKAAIKICSTSGEYVRSSADKLNKLLKNRSILTHSNPNYKAMLNSTRNILELLSYRQTMANYNTGIREKLSAELDNLNKAAYAYLEKKYTDKKSFSERALNRIDVARMVTVFVHFTKANLAIVNNQHLMKALNENSINKNSLNENSINKNSINEKSINEKSINENSINKNSKFTKDDADREYNKAIADYHNNPGFENFAKIRYLTTIKNKVQNGFILNSANIYSTLNSPKLSEHYSNVAKYSQEFKEALKDNNYKNVLPIYEKANKSYNEQKAVNNQQNPKPQNNEAKPADNIQEAKPEAAKEVAQGVPQA